MKNKDDDYMTSAKMGEARIVKDCLLCDSSMILMAQRNTKLPVNNTVVQPICKECSKKYLGEGTMLVNPDTGACVIIKDEAFTGLFEQEPPKGKIAFTEQGVLDHINTMYKKLEETQPIEDIRE